MTDNAAVSTTARELWEGKHGGQKLNQNISTYNDMTQHSVQLLNTQWGRNSVTVRCHLGLGSLCGVRQHSPRLGCEVRKLKRGDFNKVFHPQLVSYPSMNYESYLEPYKHYPSGPKFV